MGKKILIILFSVLVLVFIVFQFSSDGLEDNEIRVGVNGVYQLNGSEKLESIPPGVVDHYMRDILPEKISMPINKFVKADDYLVLFTLGMDMTSEAAIRESWIHDHPSLISDTSESKSILYKVDDQLMTTNFLEDKKNELIIGVHIISYIEITNKELLTITDRVLNNLSFQ